MRIAYLFLLLTLTTAVKAQFYFDTLHIEHYSRSSLPHYTFYMPTEISKKYEGQKVRLIGSLHRITLKSAPINDTAKAWVKYPHDSTSWDHWQFFVREVAVWKERNKRWKTTYKRKELDTLRVKKLETQHYSYMLTEIEMPYEKEEICIDKKCLFIGYGRFIDMRSLREYNDSIMRVGRGVSFHGIMGDHYGFAVTKAFIWLEKQNRWKRVFKYRKRDEEYY